MQNALLLLTLLAQSEADIAKGKVIRQQDLFDALERELEAGRCGLAPEARSKGKRKTWLKPRLTRGGVVPRLIPRLDWILLLRT